MDVPDETNLDALPPSVPQSETKRDISGNMSKYFLEDQLKGPGETLTS